MRYVLEDLLRIRSIRVDETRTKVRAKERIYEEACKKLNAKIKELKDYRIWRIKKEESLYEEIKKKIVKVKELDDLRKLISLFRERELALEKEVRDAQREKERALAELNKAKEELKEALKEQEKIEEHKKIWLSEVKKEMEYKAEKELEEFRVKELDLFGGEDEQD